MTVISNSLGSDVYLFLIGHIVGLLIQQSSLKNQANDI